MKNGRVGEASSFLADSVPREPNRPRALEQASSLGALLFFIDHPRSLSDPLLARNLLVNLKAKIRQNQVAF